MKKMMRSTFGRLFNKNWVLAATVCICGKEAYPAIEGLAEKMMAKVE